MATVSNSLRMAPAYGTTEWLEQQYQTVSEDPWGLSWRGFELCRYDHILAILDSAIARLPKERSQIRILDVGCSSGFFTQMLYGLGGMVTGIDLSETAIKRAQAKFPNINFKLGSVSDCASNGETYDIIVCLEVLYYVDSSKRDEFLAMIGSILSQEGMVLISSKIGDFPYFTEKCLIDLTSQHFKIARIYHYGWASFAKYGRFFFGLWKKTQKVRNILSADDRMEKSKTFEPVLEPPGQKPILRRMKTFVEKFPFLRAILTILVFISLRFMELCLRWKFPSKLANRMTQALKLSPTHLIIFARMAAMPKQSKASVIVNNFSSSKQ